MNGSNFKKDFDRLALDRTDLKIKNFFWVYRNHKIMNRWIEKYTNNNNTEDIDCFCKIPCNHFNNMLHIKLGHFYGRQCNKTHT